MSYESIEQIMRTARRKVHKCIWCGQLINIGDKYVDRAGSFYGEFQRDQWHPECLDASGKYLCEDEFEPYEQERPSSAPTPDRAAGKAEKT